MKYLTKKQISFFEQAQPYHGHWTLGIMNEWANSGKHRHLLKMVGATPCDIYFSEMAKQDQYKGAWVYPQEKGCAVFVKPKRKLPTAVLMQKYDAMVVLDEITKTTVQIIRESQRYFS